MDPKCNYTLRRRYPYKRQVSERFDTDRKKRSFDHGGGDFSNETISQEMLMTRRDKK